MHALPACLECGACCLSTLDTYVRVTGDDHERLAEHAERLTHFVGHRCYMRMEQGRCAALCVTGEGQFVCTIYAQRPEVCRDLGRGSSACQAELEQKSARRLTLLREVRHRATPAS